MKPSTAPRFPSSRRAQIATAPADDERLLDAVQRAAFGFFERHTDPANGLTADDSRPGSPASIASTGLALSCYPVAVERGWITRARALELALAALRFFADAPQNAGAQASGYRGFFYHFLDPRSGQRAQKCELSSIDTALLVAGALTASAYFEADTPDEREARERGEALARAVNWNWMRAGEPAVCHGWKPESGFLPQSWRGYNEALLLYVLGLGSPTHALPAQSYDAWLEGYEWREIYGHELVYAGPLFIHQLPQCWLDLRGLQDRFMREKGSDYFQNSRRATFVQREYAIRNPHRFRGYGRCCWGISASDGPGPAQLKIAGRNRHFFDYDARGVPDGPDDGTLSPWSAVASLPFAPEIVWSALRYFHQLGLGPGDGHGLLTSFNPTFPRHEGNGLKNRWGWVSPNRLGINEGPLLLMIENARSELGWKLGRHPWMVRGLRRAEFRGGWLDGAAE